MKYTPEIREKAYIAWSGLRNFERVVGEMRKQYPKLCKRLRRQTIERWHKEGHWRNRVREIDRKVEQSTDKKLVGRRVGMLKDADALYDAIVDQIINQNIVFKSAEGAINSLSWVSKRIDELTGNGELDRKRIESVALVLIQILANDGEIGKKIISKKEHFLRLLTDELQREEVVG